MLRRLVTLFAAVLLSAVSVGGVTAESPNTYTACLQKGTFYNVAVGSAPAAPCKEKDLQVSWNESGPRGEKGAQGEPGATGEAGPQGETGPQGPAGGASLTSLDDTPCSLPTGEAASIAYSIAADGAITLSCFTPQMWCQANDPGAVPFALAPECDGVTRLITITCIPVPAFWFDTNGVVADGCERSYGTAAADLYFRQERSVAPVICGSNLPVNCPGGQPQDPAAAFHWTPQATTIQAPYVTGGSRFNLSADGFLQSDPIPMTLPLTGDCFVEVNSSLGSRQDITMAVPLDIVVDSVTQQYRLFRGDAYITGLEADDVSITGGLGCQIALVDLFMGTLRDLLQEVLFPPVCIAPEPELAVFCEE